MNFLSNSHKKYFAALATAFAAIAIPAQATDCATVCENAARGAASQAYLDAQTYAYDYCQNEYRYHQNMTMTQWMNYCMNSQAPNMAAAYNNTYQMVLAQCNGSCR